MCRGLQTRSGIAGRNLHNRGRAERFAHAALRGAKLRRVVGRIQQHAGRRERRCGKRRRDRQDQRRGALPQASVTGILPMRCRHSRGPVWCTDVPVASTATVTGMSATSNS